MTERAVKYGNQCRGSKRDEMCRSQYAITRYTIIRRATSIEKTIHSAKIRSSRRTPVKTSDMMRTKTSCRCILECARDPTLKHFDDTHQKKYRSNLKEEEKNSFVVSCNEKAISAFKESVENVNIIAHSLDNNLPLDYTALLLVRVKFSMLRRDLHLNKLTEELIARGVSIPTDMAGKIRELIKLLKSDEGDDFSFLPVTCNDNFD